jgi:hypothetical protein
MIFVKSWFVIPAVWAVTGVSNTQYFFYTMAVIELQSLHILFCILLTVTVNLREHLPNQLGKGRVPLHSKKGTIIFLEYRDKNGVCFFGGNVFDLCMPPILPHLSLRMLCLRREDTCNFLMKINLPGMSTTSLSDCTTVEFNDGVDYNHVQA